MFSAFPVLKRRHISFVKRKAKFTIEQQKFKGHEKRDRILVSKVEFNFQIRQILKLFMIGMKTGTMSKL